MVCCAFMPRMILDGCFGPLADRQQTASYRVLISVHHDESPLETRAPSKSLLGLGFRLLAARKRYKFMSP